MTTYTAIPNSDVDQDSPVTQTLVTLLRDNPLAIAEGAVGAPRVQSAGVDLFAHEVNMSASFSTDDIETFLNIGLVSRFLLEGEVTTDASSGYSLRYQTSTDGGVNWSSSLTIATASSSTTTQPFTSLITVPVGTNSIRFILTNTSGTGDGDADFWVIGVGGETA